MFNRYALAGPTGFLLLMGVERRFEALLAEHGAADPSELPRALQSELLRRAIVETAAANAPTADPKMPDHATRSLTHPLFAPPGAGSGQVINGGRRRRLRNGQRA